MTSHRYVGAAAWFAAPFAGLAASPPLLDALALPLRTSPAAWSQWVLESDPTSFSTGMLAVLVVALLAYLALTNLLVLLSVAVRPRWLLAFVELVTPRISRHVLHRALGASLIGTLAVPAAASAAPASAVAPNDEVPVLHHLSPAAAAPSDVPSPAAPTSAPVPASTASGAGAGSAPPTSSQPIAGSSPTEVRRSQEVPTAGQLDGIAADHMAPHAATWRTRPGDNLWDVARAVLTDAQGTPPAPGVIAPYWRALIDANRHQLPDPDLLRPGTVLLLPDH